MTTSGTTSFDPSNADMLLEAFSRCGIRPNAITTQHMIDGRMSINLALANWSNFDVNLWKVELVEQDLTPSESEYDVDADTVLILDAYIRTISGELFNDRILTQISRTDYAVIPNKNQTGFPTTFWFDRTISPKLYLWQPPDDSYTYTLRYYCMKRIQDAYASMGQTADIPFRFYDAFCAELAFRLALKYAVDRVVMLKQFAEESRLLAMGADRERVPITIMPELTPYFS